jgi:hypothetical protein
VWRVGISSLIDLTGWREGRGGGIVSMVVKRDEAPPS